MDDVRLLRNAGFSVGIWMFFVFAKFVARGLFQEGFGWSEVAVEFILGLGAVLSTVAALVSGLLVIGRDILLKARELRDERRRW